MKSYIILFINILTRFFTYITFTYALIAVASQDAVPITKIQIIKIFITGCILGIITVVRAGLDNKKWMLRLSFIQKRLIFAPLYLITLLLFIYNYFNLKSFNFKTILGYSALFFALFVIVTIIANKKYKKDKLDLTKSITEYKNKIGGK
ncbi:MAG: hypothetical protein FWC47_10520 [Oscillospiraceae bacterium]|nr:hypothetical protein [Oscillospiraceae bacterium]